MNLQLNSLMMGKGSNYILQAPIEGLEAPPIRNSSFDYSGRDGGLITEQFYGMRQITITGTIWNDDCNHAAARRALINACPIRQDATLHIFTFDGRNYRVTGRIMKLDAPVIAPDHTAFKIEMVCPDPLIYDESTGAALEVTINKTVGGGYPTPYVLPVIWDAASNPVDVHNSGTTVIYPILELRGSATNPILTNVTTGEIMKLNLTMVAGDVVLIDMLNRTITLNGGSVVGVKDSSSIWWGLQVGQNLVSLDSSSGSDTVYAKARWFNGYLGI